MISRGTSVHIVAVVVCITVLGILESTDFGPELGSPPIVGFLLFYGLVLGGAHFYLAVRGEDGLIPVDARWRYVAALVVLLVAGAGTVYGGDRTVATIELETVGTVVIVLTVVAYFVTESVAGYRASRAR